MIRRVSLLTNLLAAVLVAGSGATPAIAAPQSLVLDPQHSNIEVYVHATWVSFTGRLKIFHSDIAIDPDGRHVDRAEMTFQFSDLKTGLAIRDREMLQWEESTRFPEVKFRLDVVEPTATGATVRGSLSIHGVEHQISFPAAVLAEGSLYAFDGEVALDYRDFGLPVIRKFFFLTVDPHLRVRFHLQGRLAGETH